MGWWVLMCQLQSLCFNQQHMVVKGWVCMLFVQRIRKASRINLLVPAVNTAALGMLDLTCRAVSVAGHRALGQCLHVLPVPH